MKKSIFLVISMFALFMLAATTQVSAQWAAEVQWDDSNCSCYEPTIKKIFWELRTLNGNVFIEGDNAYLPDSFENKYTIKGDVTLVPDTQYTLCVTILFYDESQVAPCCKGKECYTVDSGQLTQTNTYVLSPKITLN